VRYWLACSVRTRESQWILEPGPSSQSHKRQSSPTWTLSCACQSCCMHRPFIRKPSASILIVASSGDARALADDGVLATPVLYSQGLSQYLILLRNPIPTCSSRHPRVSRETVGYCSHPVVRQGILRIYRQA
jgi:hypothetical protein